ncbi:hypothetical protein B566_EDAN019329, partial [Ephemera danica]
MYNGYPVYVLAFKPTSEYSDEGFTGELYVHQQSFAIVDANFKFGKAALKKASTVLIKKKPSGGIWMEDVQMPLVGPNDVLIKIKKSAICGTDLHIYKWDEWAQQAIKPPLTIGHEFMGTVVEVGSEVDRVAVGERVTVEGHIACGFCRNCRRGRQHICDHTIGIGVSRNGGFAEYVAVPAKNVLHIDNRISDEMMSIMDPFGNATHTALSFPLLGEDVLITGIGGPIGAMAAAICRFSGARNIIGTDLSPFRRDLARKLGATEVIDPTKQNLKEIMAKHEMVGGFDIGLECSGSPAAFNDMLPCYVYRHFAGLFAVYRKID